METLFYKYHGTSKQKQCLSLREITYSNEKKSPIERDKTIRDAVINELAAQPGRAADAAGASPGLGAIHPAKRSGLWTTRQSPTSRHFLRPSTPGPPAVGRTRIAWQLPLSHVLHAPHACQRRS